MGKLHLFTTLTVLVHTQRTFVSNLVGMSANIFYDTLKDAVYQRVGQDDVKLQAIES